MAQARAGNINAADLERFIAGVHFPAEKNTIIGHAQHRGAPEKIIEFLNAAPDKTYEDIVDLATGLTLSRHQ